MRLSCDHLVERVGADAVELLRGLGDVGGRAQREADAHAGGQAQGIDQARAERVAAWPRAATPFSMPTGITLYWKTALVGRRDEDRGLDRHVADADERKAS